MSVSSEERVPGRRLRVERGIYQQPNGRYAVCFMVDGRPRFRTVGFDLDAAREERVALIEAGRWGMVPVEPQLRFGRVAGWWIARYERKVAAGDRRERTLENHRYNLDRHLLPALGSCLMRAITVEDVAELLTGLRAQGRSEKTMAGALATLHSIVRFAIRNGWIIENPVAKLEVDERPHPVRRRQRVLGRDEIGRLLAACPARYRPLIVTALYTGMRTSELLGLTWQDVDLAGGVLHVRAQLGRAHRGKPARRVALKTSAAIRDIPLVPQLARELREHRDASPDRSAAGWVFATAKGTPLGHRNAQSRALGHAARLAGLEDSEWPPLRFHDLRHTFASHLIIDLALDVAQVSRILGHAQVTTTLNIYTHLFDDARHACDIRGRMATSAFAGLLEPEQDGGNVVVLPRPSTLQGGHRSARERAAIRWAT